MVTKTNSIYIDAPPEVVYDYVSDVARHPEWAHEKLDIEVLGPARQQGTTFNYQVHMVGGKKGLGTIVRADRPSVFSYECADSDGTFRWRFDIEPEGSGTRLSHTFESLRLSTMMKLMQPALYPLMGKRMINGGLANIKAKIEAAQSTAAGST